MQEVHRLRSERETSQQEEVAKDAQIERLLETTQKLAELNDYNSDILHSLKDGHVDEHGKLLISRAEEKKQNLDVGVKSHLLTAHAVPTYRYLSTELPASPRKAPSVPAKSSTVSISTPYSPNLTGRSIMVIA